MQESGADRVKELRETRGLREAPAQHLICRQYSRAAPVAEAPGGMKTGKDFHKHYCGSRFKMFRLTCAPFDGLIFLYGCFFRTLFSEE